MSNARTAQDERDDLAAEKKRLAEEKIAAKKAKEQDKINGEFADKKAKADSAGSQIDKLKEWLVNPPFKSTNEQVKVRNILVNFLTLIGGILERHILCNPELFEPD